MSEPRERIPGFTADYSIEKKSKLIQLVKEDKRISLPSATVSGESYILPQQLMEDVETSEEDESTNGELSSDSIESYGDNECYTDETGVEICP
jgi:acyl-CoA hydrolase